MGSFRVVLVNLSVLLSLAIIIELYFGGWIRSENSLTNVIGVQRDLKIQYKQQLYKGPEIISYSRDRNGLRGISSLDDPKQIGVLTVGGSTTDQKYITDSLTWQEMLEKRYRSAGRNLSISNAGVDGQSTIGHIKNFMLWFPKIEGLKPRYVLFYIGINDAFRFQDDSRFDIISVANFNLKGRIIAEIKENSAIYNLYRRILGSIRASKLKLAHNSVDFAKIKYVETVHLDSSFYANYDLVNVSAFKSRLRKLIELTESMGAKPIFVTQPARYYKMYGTQIVGVDSMGQHKTGKYSGIDLYKILLRLNKSINEVAGNNYQVVELTNGMELEDNDFYDYVHMTPTGANKLADSLFQKLRLD